MIVRLSETQRTAVPGGGRWAGAFDAWTGDVPADGAFWELEVSGRSATFPQ